MTDDYEIQMYILQQYQSKPPGDDCKEYTRPAFLSI